MRLNKSLILIILLFFINKLMSSEVLNKDDRLYISYSIIDYKLKFSNIAIRSNGFGENKKIDLIGIGWHEYLKKENGQFYYIAEEKDIELRRNEIEDKLSPMGVFNYMEENAENNLILFGYNFKIPYLFPMEEDLKLLPEFYIVDYRKIFYNLNKQNTWKISTISIDFIGLKNVPMDSIFYGMVNGEISNFDIIYKGVVFMSFIRIR